MSHHCPRYLPLISLAICCAHTVGASASDLDLKAQDEVIIDIGDAAPETGEEILIKDSSAEAIPSPGDIIIEETNPGIADEVEEPEPRVDAASAEGGGLGKLEVRIDDIWAEYSHFFSSDSEADRTVYGKVSAVANWQPVPAWEFQISGRLDGNEQDGFSDFSTVKADYGDSFVRYRGDNLRLTVGTQTVIWGRLDEIPLSDRVSTADLSRMVLDDLEDRRRANPMVRAETYVGSGKLDLVWLIDFRPAEMPDKDSIWYPINRHTGRVLGFDPQDVPPDAVKNSQISEHAPGGDGGFGARYTLNHSYADIGVTIARTRQSIPYFRSAGPGVIEAEYPRSWAYGADAAMDAAGATWRVEAIYSSDNPVTREDLTYTTTPSIAWGGGVEFNPGDGNTRVNLQLMGMKLLDSAGVIDRREIYNINGEIEIPFDRERWRAKLDFYAGLNDKDIYVNPEIAFLGWEPHEVYLALHYFDGAEQTLGGFHEDHSSINLGWRAKF